MGHNITDDFYPGDRLYYNYKGHWYASPLCEETRLMTIAIAVSESGAGSGKAATDLPGDGASGAEAQPALQGRVWLGMPGGINYGTVQTFMVVYLAYGARFLNDKGLCGFDTPEFRAALQFYTDLYTKYHVTPPDTTTNINLESEYEAGRLAMVIDGPGCGADGQRTGQG